MMKQAIKRVLFFARLFLVPHIRLFGLALLSGLLVSVTSGLGIPLMVKYVFPVVFYAPDQGGEMPKLFEYIPWLREMQIENPRIVLLVACAVMPVTFLIRGLAMWVNGMTVSLLGVRISTTLRMEVFRKVLQLPISFMERREKGDVISRVISDTGAVQQILTRVADDLFKQPITCLVTIVMFLWMMLQNGQTGLFLLNALLIFLAFLPIYQFGKRISVKAHRALTGLGRLNTVVQQNLETMREVRAYSMEERQIQEFTRTTEEYCRNSIKLVKYQRAVIPFMEVATSIALVALLVRGYECGMNLNDFLAMATVLFFLFDSMKKAGNAFNRLNEGQGALRRLEEILVEPNTMPDPVSPQAFSEPVRGDIEFRDVSFAYDPGQPVLEHINVHIPAGQVVGLVGSSGAGKTTFAALIPRFYDVSEGAILVDGLDVRDVRVHDLRDHLALVGQQALLFSGSIRENIRMGRPNATDEEIRIAAEEAALGSFLDSQKRGLDTEVGEGGGSLSGGQRQRVALARAFVKDAPILVLDEATASLDAESEHDIQRELEKISAGRTTLIVAHRFSTIRHAQRILLFDHGCIVGDGTHDELYAGSPLYKELYDRQGID